MKTDMIKFIHKHQLLKKNTTILVGVSGGPDSMALLHLLTSIRDEWNLRVIALSVDHELRGDQSKADVQYVKKICKQWNVAVVATSVDVYSHEKKQEISTQVAARDLRYQFFNEQMKRFGAQYLALGHHGDDQVETMLMTIVRSASSTAVSGIPVKRPFASGLIIRPLLTLSKTDILRYCQQHHIYSRFDPSNKDIGDMRVWFREKIIPLIKEKNDNIHTTMQHLSETLSEDEWLLETDAKHLVNNIVYFDDNGKFASLKIAQFKSYPHALQRRAFHLILNYLYNETMTYENLPSNLSYVHERNFFSLIAEEDGTVQINFPRQLIIEQSYGTVAFYFPEEKVTEPFYKEIQVPGTTILPDESQIIAQIVSGTDQVNKGENTYVCAKELTALPLHVRTRQPGDRMSWHGLNGSKKLKDIFIDEKIPRNKRHTWPIVVNDREEILWLIGIKKGKPASSVNSTTWIQLYFQKGN